MSEIKFVTPWVPVGQQGDDLIRELEREVGDRHVLWGPRTRALARRIDADDVLLEIKGDDNGYAVVHLTWSGKRELDHVGPA
jgi:hypothetical protein